MIPDLFRIRLGGKTFRFGSLRRRSLRLSSGQALRLSSGQGQGGLGESLNLLELTSVIGFDDSIDKSSCDP